MNDGIAILAEKFTRMVHEYLWYFMTVLLRSQFRRRRTIAIFKFIRGRTQRQWAHFWLLKNEVCTEAFSPFRKLRKRNLMFKLTFYSKGEYHDTEWIFIIFIFVGILVLRILNTSIAELYVCRFMVRSNAFWNMGILASKVSIFSSRSRTSLNFNERRDFLSLLNSPSI